MILFELKAIIFNVLFGIFFFITINTLSLYEIKIKFKIITNILYFVLTIFCGIIYITYLDLIFFSFNYYYILFLILGFIIAKSFDVFKTQKQILVFNYFVFKTTNIIKKVTLFLINYNFWNKLLNKFKKIIKKKE